MRDKAERHILREHESHCFDYSTALFTIHRK